MAGGYGVGASLASVGRGGGLAGAASSREQQAMQMLGETASQETQRDIANKQTAAQAKAGGMQLGATVGATVGTAFGPVGTLIGGVLGGLAGSLFAVCMAVVLVVCSALPSTSEASMLTQLELHQILSYAPETGVFTWLEPNRNAKVGPGDRAGSEKKKLGKRGENLAYRVIKIDGKAYPEHRLAWLYMTGDWPIDEIDHRNRVRTDNVFDNLRPATRKQNCENRDARAGSLSGFRGVSWSGGKWCAVIMHFGKQVVLGSFDDIEQAKEARLAAECKLFTHSTRTE
jgi:hypothetical protein